MPTTSRTVNDGKVWLCHQRTGSGGLWVVQDGLPLSVGHPV
jgi:hypothetical protein